MDLSGIGVWDARLRGGDRPGLRDALAEVDELGYTALWVPDVGGDLFGDLGILLAGTRRATVATGILNLWVRSPAETASGRAALVADHPGRLLLGIGVSHAPLVEELLKLGRYDRPVARMSAYLDELDSATPPVPATERALAALGPRMLQLAAERSRGAHPYLVTPEHTAVARQALGSQALLAPEQAVLLETDAERARELGRRHLEIYCGLPNYVNNWQRLGFTEADVAQRSDRLVDGLVAWGDEEAVSRRVRQHLDAGADHVCVQVVDGGKELPLDTWRRLAPALLAG